MHAFTQTEDGFCFKLSREGYARQAVVKALYPYRDTYIISYDFDGNNITVYFEKKELIDNVEQQVSEILKALDFQMIRYDTVRQTDAIRQLLVGRALYATCIENDNESVTLENNASWEEDSRQIFKTWSDK